MGILFSIKKYLSGYSREKFYNLLADSEYNKIIKIANEVDIKERGILQIVSIAYFKTGKHETANKLLRKAFLYCTSDFEKNEIRHDLEINHFEMRDYNSAVGYLLEMNEEDLVTDAKEDKIYSVLTLLGKTYFLLGDYESAIAKLNLLPINRKDEELSEANQYLGDAYFKLNDEKKAIARYKKAVEQDSDNMEVLKKLNRL